MAKYVIVEEGWEYNDEYYHQPECGGYEIKSKLYSEDQLEEAQKEVDQLNEKAKSDKWFRQYPRNWSDESEDDDYGDPIAPFKLIKIEE
jgi:hypothetical protein